MDYEKIVKKLVGSIDPVGETNTDEERFGNLKEMCALVEDLLGEISRVTAYADRAEGSMRRAGKYAQVFLNDIKEK